LISGRHRLFFHCVCYRTERGHPDLYALLSKRDVLMGKNSER
jgi:hypothetical protein